MQVRYAVTFEFDTQPPITHRGTVAASTMPTCFARAARDAVRAHPGLKWSSMACVLLERLDAATDDVAPGRDADALPTAHETVVPPDADL
jgi:hypothetical protein